VIAGRLILAIAVLALGACRTPPPASISRADVALSVRPDGTIEVREILTVRFSGQGTWFERRIPLEHAESLSFESASLDGHQMQPGSRGDTALEVDEDGDLVVTWTFRDVPNAPRLFELAYQAHGAVSVRGNRGSLRLAAIPARRAYSIDQATVQLVVDPSMHVFDGTGIAEAGWTVARTTDGISAERNGLSAAEGATVMAEVGIDRGVIEEPSWQRYQDWTRDLIAAWISGGLFILVIGAGVLWIIRFQHPRRRLSTPPLTESEERERQAVRSGLRTTGGVSIVLAAALAVVTWLTLLQFGLWPMAVSLSILVVGLVFLVAGRRFP
jgi:hypothetical protein